MQAEGRILGVLELLNKREGDEDDVKLLTKLGRQAGRDLRSPLTLVQSYAEMIADEPDAARRRECSAKVSRQILRLESTRCRWARVRASVPAWKHSRRRARPFASRAPGQH